MYRNAVKFYDGDLFANVALFSIPFLLYGLWQIVVGSIQPNRKLMENIKRNKSSKFFLYVFFCFLFVGVVLLGIFSGNWAHSGSIDLPLLISGGGLYLLSYLVIFLKIELSQSVEHLSIYFQRNTSWNLF